MHLLDGPTLLRSLPNPLTGADHGRIRDARPAESQPRPAKQSLRVQRRVSSRGQRVIAGQKVQFGIGHAGATVTIEDTGGTFRITHAGQRSPAPPPNPSPTLLPNSVRPRELDRGG
jgi:hypothetical protein